MSFMIPKKPQILYAPMLASFGGGSARGFNPGGGLVWPAIGEALFTNTSDAEIEYVFPNGFTTFSVIVVGAGGGGNGQNGGAGGALGYENSYTMPSNRTLKIRVGIGGIGGQYNVSGLTEGLTGGSSYIKLSDSTNIVTCSGGGGTATPGRGTRTGGDGGGDGGLGGIKGGSGGGGGGGAGGYSGNGGNGGASSSSSGSATTGDAGSGGGGGGAGGGSVNEGGAGGGVGIYGSGSSGGGGSGGGAGSTGSGGTGGSGGGTGLGGSGSSASSDTVSAGSYGGGAQGARFSGGKGAPGAVRIIWGTAGRTFPSTNVALSDSDGNVFTNPHL